MNVSSFFVLHQRGFFVRPEEAKTLMRRTVRLGRLLTIRAPKSITDVLPLSVVAEEFTSANERMISYF